jgi:hypothetical protein
MLTRMSMILGFALAVLLLIAALFAWQDADTLALRWRLAGDSAAWGMRCAAVGLAAAAEVLMLSVIGRWVYSRDRVSDILRLCGLLVFMLASVTAVALALAGR